MVNYSWLTNPERDLFTRDEAQAIALIDAKAVSTQPQKYAKRNSEEYYLILNTYGLMLRDIGAEDLLGFYLGYVRTKGLASFVKRASETADVLISKCQEDYVVPADVVNNWWYVTTKSLTTKQALLALRFAKRFSGEFADLLENESLDDFCNTERDNAKWDKVDCNPVREHIGDDEYVTPILRSAVANTHSILDAHMWHMLDWFDTVGEPILPPGATSDTCNCFLCKRIGLDEFGIFEHETLRFGEAVDPYMTPLFGNGKVKDTITDIIASKTGDSSMRAFRQYTVRDRYVEQDIHVVKPIAVPKSYKKARIIAPSPVKFNAEALGWYRQQLREIRWLDDGSECSDINDPMWFSKLECVCAKLDGGEDEPFRGQNRNRALAAQGSKEPDAPWTIATVDLSHASDSVRKSMIRRVMVSANEYLQHAPTHYLMRDKVKELKMYATSGYALTFLVETRFFEKAVYLSYAMYWDFLEPRKIKYRNVETGRLTTTTRLDRWIKGTAAVYGDDIACDVRVLPTLLDILSSYHCCVNLSKSFWTGSFRESCGHEYIDGERVDHMYWPRKGMSLESSRISPDWQTGTSDTISRLFAYSNALTDSEYGKSVVSFMASYINTKLKKDTVHYAAVLPPHYTGTADVFRAYAPCFCYEIDKKRVWLDSLLATNDDFKPYIGKNIKLCVTGVRNKNVPAKQKSHCACNALQESQLYEFIELDAYQTYLKYGPFYETELDRLVGVSTSRLKRYAEGAQEAYVGVVRL